MISGPVTSSRRMSRSMVIAALRFGGRSSITSAQLRLVPADVSLRMELDDRALRSCLRHCADQCLPLCGIDGSSASIDLHERIDRNVEVLDDLRARVDHEALELRVVGAGFDQ